MEKNQKEVVIKSQPKKVNTSPDKREMMLFRETLRLLIIVFLTAVITMYIYDYVIKDFSKQEVVKEVVQVPVEVPVVKQIDYTDLKVVIKASKDIRKYFISYKKYYSKDKYEIIVKEISFTEYMHMNTNDTLTTETFNIK